MAEVIELSPQDALPNDAGVLVMRRFGEDDPRARLVVIEVLAHAHTRQVLDGDDDAALARGIDAGRDLADARGLERVYVVDRTASRIAHEAVTHHGDRSTVPDLADTDPEDGERGPDMRDRRPS